MELKVLNWRITADGVIEGRMLADGEVQGFSNRTCRYEITAHWNIEHPSLLFDEQGKPVEWATYFATHDDRPEIYGYVGVRVKSGTYYLREAQDADLIHYTFLITVDAEGIVRRRKLHDRDCPEFISPEVLKKIKSATLPQPRRSTK